MKKLAFAVAVSSVLTGTLRAADKPETAPAPAWVRPLAIPADVAKADDAPIRILLSDQQISLERGKQTTYTEVAIKIQTPQGLAAGNVSFPWRPDTDTLTVHKLAIRRGDQIIDVLESGQTFTVVRREQNLENATLDGVLTANIQPEGLQVGDVVDFAVSISSSDPTMKGHAEQIAAAWNGFTVGRAHLRLQWPTSLPIRLRQVGGLPPLKPVKAGGLTSVEFALDNVQPIQPPKGAPARFQLGRIVEATDFTSWADLGALMAPLYDKAATLPAQGSLRTELDRIMQASPDAKARTEAALTLVQDRVRYVALMMGLGGYVPADAELTWSRRYGDCKGKTALLLALLHAMDIEAEPVIANALSGDGIDARLPMVGLFNHVLIRATIGSRVYWLDGTRTGDTSLDRLNVPNFGWGLPLRPAGATLIRMLPSPAEKPTRDTTIRIDATAGLTSPAPTTVETIVRGDDSIQLRANLANLAGAARDNALRQYWKGQYSFIDIKAVAATYDVAMGEQHLSMTGTAKLDWAGDSYETDGTRVGYRADFSRDASEGKDAPFAVAFPYFERTRETIVLPIGQGDFRIGKATEIDQTVAGVQYKRHATIQKNVYVIEKTERSLVPEIAADTALAAQAALRTLSEKVARVEKPAGYATTDADLAAARANEPTTSSDYVSRALVFLGRDMRPEALRDYDRAIELEPTNVYAWANRAITRVQAGDYAGARADIVKSDAIDPRFGQTFIARGMLAEVENRPADAVAAYTSALKSEPGDDYSLLHRSASYALLGDVDRALADKTARIAALPDDAYILTDRANYEAEMGRMAAAESDYARALGIKPDPSIYLDRARHRAPIDLEGRQEDIDAALKLEPANVDALVAAAELASDRRDFAKAITIYTQVLAKAPNNTSGLVARGVALARSGNVAAAERDFAAARGRQDIAESINELCWQKATGGIMLESALKDCTELVAMAPNQVSYLDSHGFVLLRLGRLDQAIATYDKTLALNPYLPTSLYGRGIAYTRKGDIVRAKADLAAAARIKPSVRADFVRYGVTPSPDR